MAFENGYLANAEVITFPIAARCSMYIGAENVARLYKQAGEAYDAAYCEGFSNLRHARDISRAADVVILAASWRKWEAGRISETISSLVDAASEKVIIFGRKHFGEIRPLAYLEVPQEDRAEIRNDVSAEIAEINGVLKRRLPGPDFVDVQAMICRKARSCPVFTPSSRLISFDGVHLTVDGARYLGQLIFQHPRLADLR